MYDSYLVHHGIKGQKWGVRRYQNSDGTLTVEGKMRTARNENVKSKRSDLKNRGVLTNAQLKEKIERLQLEKQLRELTDKEINSGRTYVTDILKDIGKKVLTTAGAGAILYAGKAAVSGNFDMKEFGSALFNGGAKKK